jgi:Spy/CpxP family protein refolding chaperone
MNMKRKCLWILTPMLAVPMLAFGTPPAQAQGSGPGGGQMGGPGGNQGERGPVSPDERLKRMTQNFNLTADQQSKIKPILVSEQTKMEELRNSSSGDRQAMRGKMMQIRQDSMTQIRAVLDDKQKKKFDKQEQQREKMMQNRQSGGRGGPGGSNQGGGAPPQN